MTDTNTSNADEMAARSMTDARLAADLNAIASNVRWCAPEEREARLREAARRLTSQFEQMLVTLDDRRQVGLLPDNEVHLRTSPGACWDVPLKRSSHPHEPNTVYFGEW